MTYWEKQKGELYPVQLRYQGLVFPEQLSIYLTHLTSLNIVKVTDFNSYFSDVLNEVAPNGISSDELWTIHTDVGRDDTMYRGQIALLTDFGRLFGDACIPKDLPDSLKVVDSPTDTKQG